MFKYEQCCSLYAQEGLCLIQIYNITNIRLKPCDYPVLLWLSVQNWKFVWLSVFRWYQVMEGSPRNRYKVNYCLAEILRFFWLYKILQCSCCDHLEHPASCRLNLDHDENSGNLYENWERRSPVRNIYQSQQRQYNRKRIVAMALIVTAKTAIADGTIFLHNL